LARAGARRGSRAPRPRARRAGGHWPSRRRARRVAAARRVARAACATGAGVSAGWRALAPGKVNLALFIGAPRAGDGLHPLVSVVQPVSLADELTLRPAPAGAREDEVLCPGVEGPNLAGAALATFRVRTGWD